MRDAVEGVSPTAQIFTLLVAATIVKTQPLLTWCFDQNTSEAVCGTQTYIQK